jgi:hypothetical protein
MEEKLVVAIPDNIERNLSAFFSREDLNGKTIAIYSAGRLTQSILASGKYPNHRISRIFDKNPALHGQKIGQIPIESPQTESLRNAIILIISTRAFPSIYLELKAICNESETELVDIAVEYSSKPVHEHFDFRALQADYREQGLVNAFAQTGSRNYLWHVAMPKSGSTWLTSVLENIYRQKGWEVGRLFPYSGRRRFEIDPRYFFIDGDVDSNVFFHHQHCEYSDYTAYLILRSRAKCIVQIRGILDAAASMIDWYKHMLNTSHPDAVSLPRNAAQWSNERFVDYVIDHDLPWYVRFVEGWLNSDLMSRGDLLTQIRYEDLLTNPSSEVSRICAWANLAVSPAEIESALLSAGNADTKKNRGVTGRGRQLFSPQQLSRARRLAGYYFDNPDDVL